MAAKPPRHDEVGTADLVLDEARRCKHLLERGPRDGGAVSRHHERPRSGLSNDSEAFEGFDEHWAPRVAAELNGQAVKLAKVEGEFIWHSHDDADELFLVVSGDLDIEFRNRETVTLGEGELLVVPAGVEHRPVAGEEAEILLFEPAETRNTGDVETERTRTDLERVS